MRAVVYLRVSTSKQDEANQEPECLALCAARGWDPVIIRERESGAKRRPGWEQAKEKLRRGECRALVVWSLDRIGRNAEAIAADLRYLWTWGATVASVRDSWSEQAPGPMRDLVVSIMAWVADMERRRLIERTRAGLERARAAGVVLGRPRVLSDEVLCEARRMRAEGASWGQIAAATGAGKGAVQRAVGRAERRTPAS